MQCKETVMFTVSGLLVMPIIIDKMVINVKKRLIYKQFHLIDHDLFIKLRYHMHFKKVVPLLLLLLLCVYSQSTRKQGKTPSSKPTDDNFIMSIVNTILGGPYDAPISTRIMNKLGYIATGLFGSVFAYFKWFRQRKNRREKIN
jgi:hypothetical protein